MVQREYFYVSYKEFDIYLHSPPTYFLHLCTKRKALGMRKILR